VYSSNKMKMNRFLPLVLVTLLLLLSSCSERSEYGKKSDYEKLGAVSTVTTAPTVSSVNPTDNSNDVSVSTTVAVTFSETMSTSTITTNTDNTTCSGSFRLSSDNFTTCIRMSAAPSASNSDKTFSVTPYNNISGLTTYKIQITNSVTDNSSNSLASAYTTTTGFTTYSSGTIKGTVKQSNGNALSDVLVSFSGANVDSTTTNNSGNFNKSLGLGSYTLTYTKSGYISTTQSSAIATDNQTVTANVTLLANTCSAGTVEGTIIDAVSGNAVSGVSLSVRSGLNVTSGSTTGITATSANNGTYTLSSMNAGGYTVQASKDGYISTFITVNVCGNMSNQNASMSEELSSGSMRFVLSWPTGSTGDDLDSHLTGPDNASGRFHVYHPTSNLKFYYATGNNACSSCSSDQLSDNVTLDLDDQDGPPGTETITITKVRSGTYRYSVFDYDNGAGTPNASSTKLSTSKALVKVYYNNTTTTYSVPQDAAGTLWTVFTFTTSGGLVEVGTMGHQTNDGTIE
jgi:hypothetical protein